MVIPDVPVLLEPPLFREDDIVLGYIFTIDGRGSLDKLTVFTYDLGLGDFL